MSDERMALGEIAPGLLRWTAPHPEWTPEEGGPDGWEREVGCLAWDAGGTLILIDPLLSDGGEPELWPALDALAAAHHQPVAIVLTVWWHERSAGLMFERYMQSVGAEVWAPEGTVARFECPVTNPFRPGDELPGGMQAHQVERNDEVALWLPAVRALAVADVLLGRDGGLRLCPASWVGGDEGLAHTRAALGELLELPIEMVIPSHGEPVLAGGRDALAAALHA